MGVLGRRRSQYSRNLRPYDKLLKKYHLLIVTTETIPAMQVYLRNTDRAALQLEHHFYRPRFPRSSGWKLRRLGYRRFIGSSRHPPCTP